MHFKEGISQHKNILRNEICLELIHLKKIFSFSYLKRIRNLSKSRAVSV